MMLYYIRTRPGNQRHVAEEIVSEFEKTIAEETDWPGRTEWPGLLTRSIRGAGRYFPVLPGMFGHLLSLVPDEHYYFAVLMGAGNIHRTIPWFLRRNRGTAIYLFDAWEPQFDLIAETICRYHVDTIFFSAKQAMLHFRDRLPDKRCYWVPEGIRPEAYRAVPYHLKDISVLQLGRKYDQYHEAVVGCCEQEGIGYLYEKVKGEIIFPTHTALADGLARTRISICFPSSLTHPQRSGRVATMTQRYLQSILAKCLIVGAMPEEMEELFGYCPVIAADLRHPAAQLREILANFADYIPLIERNYESVMNGHLWKHRMSQIARLLEADS